MSLTAMSSPPALTSATGAGITSVPVLIPADITGGGTAVGRGGGSLVAASALAPSSRTCTDASGRATGPAGSSGLASCETTPGVATRAAAPATRGRRHRREAV